MKKKSKTGIFVLTKLPRMLLIMKSIVILLFCTLNLQAAVYSQQQKKFDISLNNVTVSDVFRYLHEVSQYDFVYDSDAVKQMQPVSVDLQNTDIESVLNTVLRGRLSDGLSRTTSSLSAGTNNLPLPPNSSPKC